METGGSSFQTNIGSYMGYLGMTTQPKLRYLGMTTQPKLHTETQWRIITGYPGDKPAMVQFGILGFATIGLTVVAAERFITDVILPEGCLAVPFEMDLTKSLVYMHTDSVGLAITLVQP